jgi:serine protease
LFHIEMLRALPALVAACLLVGVADARADRLYRAGEVVVHGHVWRIHDGSSVRTKVAELSRRGVPAVPNMIAHASFIPDDPGRGNVAGGWQGVQWNFLDSLAGVNAPAAWDNLIAAGRPGGKGVVVAVVDTGVAYRNYKRFRRSPDLRGRIRRGYDFVDNDRIPLDHNGHGTHVASTIAESADNGLWLTGLAYGATILPVRVLDRRGEGDSAAIARGIRYAADHGAQVINLSFEFSASVRSREIPDILSALRRARRKGALVVGASGNAHARAVAYPAKATDVMSVGAITEHGCQADYSNGGPTLDISAPGGGFDADIPSDPNCDPDDDPGRDIFQLTFKGSVRRFGLPGGYEGTSMAAPHVSATAALVIASGVLGRHPSPAAIERRLEETAVDLGKPGPDARYGAGKVDAAAATARPTPTPSPTPSATPSPTVTPT